MLKNKIYKYLSGEIFKNFITILLTFTAIAWVVRAVNFLDLMVEDGFNTTIYFKYAALNITSIITRFVPLAFLISLTVSILKFERQQELLILWTSGLNKIHIVNLMFRISIIMMLVQLILTTAMNPKVLNFSRSLLKNSQLQFVGSLLKEKQFNDTVEGLTIFVEEKDADGTFKNIFISPKTISGRPYHMRSNFI